VEQPTQLDVVGKLLKLGICQPCQLPPAGKTLPATQEFRRRLFLENAIWRNASVKQGIGGTGVVYSGIVRPRVRSSKPWESLKRPNAEKKKQAVGAWDRPA
jgi:hypothetical protein